MAYETVEESQSPLGDDNYRGLLRRVGLGSRQLGHVGRKRAARTGNRSHVAMHISGESSQSEIGSDKRIYQHLSGPGEKDLLALRNQRPAPCVSSMRGFIVC